MTNPYKALPDFAFWRRAVANCPEVDPVVAPPFIIHPEEKVATAGSCFAQHIARHLKKQGFNYYVAESAHPIVTEGAARDFNYGTFSCRYGNVYTSLQLKQLVQRAFGEFSPKEQEWVDAEGNYVDPFRPQIQPGGFISRDELEADREQHLAAVRFMIQTMDVFVFTLGLTECWVSTEDGAVFPVCPGVSGGSFDAARYSFRNLTVDEITSDMAWVIDRFRAVNPALKIVLTVSPVPLMATAAPNRHALTATTYSKAVLRVAAEQLSQSKSNVAYFPSYEIITGASARGAYFADDLRSVTESGVSHVMRCFIRNYTRTQSSSLENVEAPASRADRHIDRMEALVRANCDEEALDPVA